MDSEFEDNALPGGMGAEEPASRGKAGASRTAAPNRPDVAPNKMRRAGRPQTARIQRAPVREVEREADPRGAAPPGGERLHRARRRTEDPFFIAKADIPSHMSYQWVRETCHGQPDGENVINARENHWKPVPASRHPHLVVAGETGGIRKKGMILMERPKYLTEEARQEDYQIALEQVRGKERLTGETPAGQMTRDHPSVRNNSYIKKSYVATEIPD